MMADVDEKTTGRKAGYETAIPLDADEAMKAFEHGGGVLVLDEATNDRLLRKIDLHLMPVHPRYAPKRPMR